VQEERSFTGAYLKPLLERSASAPLVPSGVEGSAVEGGAVEGQAGGADGSAAGLGAVQTPTRRRRKKVVEGVG
jgi:hypothetical protein